MPRVGETVFFVYCFFFSSFLLSFVSKAQSVWFTGAVSRSHLWNVNEICFLKEGNKKPKKTDPKPLVDLSGVLMAAATSPATRLSRTEGLLCFLFDYGRGYFPVAALLALVKRLMKSAFRVDLGSISTDDNSPYSWSTPFVLMATNNLCAAGCGVVSLWRGKGGRRMKWWWGPASKFKAGVLWGPGLYRGNSVTHFGISHSFNAKMSNISGNVTSTPSSN